MLLHFILNDFSIRFIRVNHIEQETKKEIELIVTEHNYKPYSNIYRSINKIKKVNTDIPLIAPLIDALILVYRERQVMHVSKFYSKIRLSTLRCLLGLYENNENLDDEFFSMYGWTKKDNGAVITKEIANSNNKDQKRVVTENIAFIEQMNVQYEKLINKHKDIKTYITKTN